MSQCCAVANCKNTSKIRDLSFHSFPKKENDPNLRAQWWSKCRRNDRSSPYKTSKICDIHFHEKDLIEDKFKKFSHLPNFKNKKSSWSKRLAPGAIPSLHLPLDYDDSMLSPEQPTSRPVRFRRKKIPITEDVSSSVPKFTQKASKKLQRKKSPQETEDSCEVDDNEEIIPSSPLVENTEERLQSDTHCQSVMRSMFLDESLMDVTIFAQGKSMKAHRAVLRQASGYFKEVLSIDLTAECEVILRDVEFEDLVKLIGFIYMGEVSIKSSVLCRFLEMTEMLEVYSLLPWDYNLDAREVRVENLDEWKSKNPIDESERCDLAALVPFDDNDAAFHGAHLDDEVILKEETVEISTKIAEMSKRKLLDELPHSHSPTPKMLVSHGELEDLDHGHSEIHDLRNRKPAKIAESGSKKRRKLHL